MRTPHHAIFGRVTHGGKTIVHHKRVLSKKNTVSQNQLRIKGWGAKKGQRSRTNDKKVCTKKKKPNIVGHLIIGKTNFKKFKFISLTFLPPTKSN